MFIVPLAVWYSPVNWPQPWIGDGRFGGVAIAGGRRAPIILSVLRRLHAERLFTGRVVLDPVQAKHAREVLRLAEGSMVELFDDRGATATGKLLFPAAGQVAVDVETLHEPQAGMSQLVVAAAVPKGERADWMVEKLSELGVAAFIPLAADRSVALPKGLGKHDRWVRIATESAKQSRREGVMRIEQLTPVGELLSHKPRGLVLSTGQSARSILEACDWSTSGELTLFVGPEGGWTESELEAFASAGIQAVALTRTVLRVETAAIAAAAVVQTLLDQARPNRV